MPGMHLDIALKRSGLPKRERDYEVAKLQIAKSRLVLAETFPLLIEKGILQLI